MDKNKYARRSFKHDSQSFKHDSMRLLTTTVVFLHSLEGMWHSYYIWANRKAFTVSDVKHLLLFLWACRNIYHVNWCVCELKTTQRTNSKKTTQFSIKERFNPKKTTKSIKRVFETDFRTIKTFVRENACTRIYSGLNILFQLAKNVSCRIRIFALKRFKSRTLKGRETNKKVP